MDGDKKSEPAPEPEGHWQFAPEGTQNDTPTAQEPAADEVSWTGSEFIAHHKGAGWYAVATIAMLLICGMIYLITRELFATALFGIMAVLFGVMAAQKPRVQSYKVNRSGVIVGNKFYPYSDFKSFSVIEEGAFSSIEFMPMKRFKVPLSIYYDPKDEARIAEAISQNLPVELPKKDVIDNFTRRIRF